MQYKFLAAAGIALAVGGVIFYSTQHKTAPVVVIDTTPQTQASSSDNSEGSSSPFDPVVAKADDKSPETGENSGASATDTNPQGVSRRITLSASSDAKAMQAYELGTSDLTDDQILDLILRLKTDKAFLQAVADEFRAETNPARLKRLAYLLGESEDPALTTIATDMVYSGNRDSELAGLDLLRKLQPFDPSARDVVMNILTSDADPEVMVGALNVLVTPGQTTESERQTIVDHLQPLLSSDSAVVRQRSVSMISKWSSGAVASDALLQGLSDVDGAVRKTAAYATMNLDDPSPAIIEALFGVLENQDELPRARKGARRSLKDKNLSEGDKLRLQAADAQMREQYARKP